MNKHNILAWVPPKAELQTKTFMQVIYLSGSRCGMRRINRERGESIPGFFWKLAHAMSDWCLITPGPFEEPSRM